MSRRNLEPMFSRSVDDESTEASGMLHHGNSRTSSFPDDESSSPSHQRRSEIQRIRDKAQRLRESRGSPQGGSFFVASLPRHYSQDDDEDDTHQPPRPSTTEHLWRTDAASSKRGAESIEESLSASTFTGPSPSKAAEQARQQMMQGFDRKGKPRDSAVPAYSAITPMVPSQSSVDASIDLTLHDLCAEAVSTDDVAWRNALHLLSQQPQLASVTDQGWLPLHICCMGQTPPPTYMIRALLYAHPASIRATDHQGRLALHFLAASSADVSVLQILVEEYVTSFYERDDLGMIPLHVLLKNLEIQVTPLHVRILLGLTLPEEVEHQRRERSVLQRRGEHLDLKLDDLTDLRHKPRPVTILNRDAIREAEVMKYPADVQASLRQLNAWKRRNHPANELLNTTTPDPANDHVYGPASMTTPETLELPIHMVVRRGVVNSDIVVTEQPVDDDDKLVSEVPSMMDVEQILRILITVYPEGLVARESENMTPLLMTLSDTESSPSHDIVELLLGKRCPVFTSLPDWALDMPWSQLSRTSFLNPAMVPEIETQQLPLHIAVEEHASNKAIIQSIYNSYPGAVEVQDHLGRTPLHVLLSNDRGVVPVDPFTLTLLSTTRVAKIPSNDQKLPIDLLIDNSRGLPYREPRCWDANANDGRVDMASAYRTFFEDSFAAIGRPTSRNMAGEILRKLRQLPPWLRKPACSALFVQELLIEEIAQPLTCFMILLDGLLLVGILTVFRIQLKEFADSVELGDEMTAWLAYLLYGLATVRLVFRILLATTSVSLNEFMYLCFSNWWLVVDYAALALAMAGTGLLQESSDEDLVYSIGTAATGLLWISAVGFVATWCHGMALFAGVLSRICTDIFWSFFSIGVLVVSFAQMFHTLLQVDCSTAASSIACTARESYRTTYLLLRGEDVTSLESDSYLSREVTVLVTFFVLSALFLLVGVVASTVFSVLQLEYDGVAEESFWESKIAFVLAVSDWDIGLSMFRGSRAAEGILKRGWDRMISGLSGIDQGAQTSKKTSKSSSIMKFLWLVLSLAVLPLWILAGVISLGLLWPPQVRRALFRPFPINHFHHAQKQRGEYSRFQESSVRDELLNVKVMSFEKSKLLENDIREMKAMLRAAVKKE